MALVSVIDALDGNTLVITPPWSMNGRTGNLVRICGMNAPQRSTERGQLAHCKVSLMLAGSYVTIARTYPPEGVVLPCEVEYRGLPIWMHFPEYSESGLWEVESVEIPETVIDVNS